MRGINVPRLRKELCSDKLPLDFSGHWLGHPCYDRAGKLLDRFNVLISKSEPCQHKSSKHRVYVQCNECFEWYPAGRLHQHMKVHAEKTHSGSGTSQGHR